MRILIVEESRVMRQILVRTLRQAGYAGHLVIEAVDGHRGLRLAREEGPDLVLSGWNVPGLTGLELLRTLRAAGRRTPFGFVTAEASSPDVVALAEAAGAAFVVAKPVTAESLREALAVVLR
jgi:two-component system, chemotaxis family, chemotaxis protein CheY